MLRVQYGKLNNQYNIQLHKGEIFTKELIAYHSYFICCERADVFFQITNASFEINSVTTKTEKR